MATTTIAAIRIESPSSKLIAPWQHTALMVALFLGWWAEPSFSGTLTLNPGCCSSMANNRYPGPLRGRDRQASSAASDCRRPIHAEIDVERRNLNVLVGAIFRILRHL